MFGYDIIYPEDLGYTTKYVDNIFSTISKIVEKRQSGTINIVFLDDESIKNLNNNYRQKDSYTDVLSFHYFDDFWELEDEDTAGEVILSKTKILEQAVELWHSPADEFYRLLIHSLLHILGYDHIQENDYKIMQSLENQIWEEVFGEKDK